MMLGACCTVMVSRTVVVRRDRCVEVYVERYDVAVGEVDGEPRLLDTRTGQPWAGEFTEAEQAEADEAMERARVMLELDRAWRKAA